jgi:preprotein translocase subunit SecE
VAKPQVSSRKRPNAITRFGRETIAELRKVNWPTREEATQLTIVVVVVVTATSAFLGLLDFLFARFFAFIIGLGPSGL